jgi:hypothetical protein
MGKLHIAHLAPMDVESMARVDGMTRRLRGDARRYDVGSREQWSECVLVPLTNQSHCRIPQAFVGRLGWSYTLLARTARSKPHALAYFDPRGVASGNKAYGGGSNVGHQGCDLDGYG